MAQKPDRIRLAAGLDEAGRGCLAGPVVAAAVILPELLPGLADSKKLSARARAALTPKIKSVALAWSIGVIWPRRIERINILQAALEAMARAAATLKYAPDLLLLDGNQCIPIPVLTKAWRGPNPPAQRAIVKGDTFVPPISAASIIAKTFRDQLMAALAKRWPAYGFELHKGYGTTAHLAALRAFGPCPLHRLTFRGVAQAGNLL